MQVIERATHVLDERRAGQSIRSQNATTSFTDQCGPNNSDVVNWTKLARRRYKCNIVPPSTRP